MHYICTAVWNKIIGLMSLKIVFGKQHLSMTTSWTRAVKIFKISTSFPSAAIDDGGPHVSGLLIRFNYWQNFISWCEYYRDKKREKDFFLKFKTVLSHVKTSTVLSHAKKCLITLTFLCKYTFLHYSDINRVLFFKIQFLRFFNSSHLYNLEFHFLLKISINIKYIN